MNENRKLTLALVPSRFLLCPTLHHSPNIDAVGRICLDTINANWSPALRLSSVCLSLQALLASPNPDDPLANVCTRRVPAKQPLMSGDLVCGCIVSSRLILYLSSNLESCALRSSALQNVAAEWKKNERAAIATAKQWTRAHASVRIAAAIVCDSCLRDALFRVWGFQIGTVFESRSDNMAR
jgi:ubiquitin-protein ligase